MQTAGQQRGFTLVEMLVSIVIGLILVAAGGKLYVDSKYNNGIQAEIKTMQQNGRFVLDLLSSDIRRAGYHGGNINRGSIAGTGIQTDNGTCPSTGAQWGAMIDRSIYGLDDDNDSYACIPDTDYLRGDILSVRYAEGEPVTTTPSGDELFMRSSLTQGAVFQGKNELHPDNAITASYVTVRKLVSNAYYIGPSAVVSCADGSSPPALYRKALGSTGAPVTQELVSGVENLQIMYEVDVNGDGSLYRVLDADQMSTTDWQSISRIHLWLLVRQTCTYGDYTDPNSSYPMGSQTYAYPSTDRNLRRILFARAINVRNH